MGHFTAKFEVFFPFDGEDVTLDDFFPVSIQISWAIKDPVEMLGNLALACVHAFFDEPKVNKRFKQQLAKDYGVMLFDTTQAHISKLVELCLSE